eukprot:72749-Amphidinium_carterae.1
MYKQHCYNIGGLETEEQRAWHDLEMEDEEERGLRPILSLETLSNATMWPGEATKECPCWVCNSSIGVSAVGCQCSHVLTSV